MKIKEKCIMSTMGIKTEERRQKKGPEQYKHALHRLVL